MIESKNKILFVGSNPSTASVDNSAFHEDTRSGKILMGWIKDIQGSISFVNVADQKTKSNKSLTKAEIKANIEKLKGKIDSIAPQRIVALGKTATYALTLLHLNFYEMPHPSGRNRILNNSNYIEEKIKGLRKYLSPFKEKP